MWIRPSASTAASSSSSAEISRSRPCRHEGTGTARQVPPPRGRKTSLPSHSANSYRRLNVACVVRRSTRSGPSGARERGGEPGAGQRARERLDLYARRPGEQREAGEAGRGGGGRGDGEDTDRGRHGGRAGDPPAHPQMIGRGRRGAAGCSAVMSPGGAFPALAPALVAGRRRRRGGGWPISASQ